MCIRDSVVLEAGVNMRSVSDNLSSSVAFTLSEIAQIDPASLKMCIRDRCTDR